MTILPAEWAGTQRAPVTYDYSTSRESWGSRLHASAGPDVHADVVPKCGRQCGGQTAALQLAPTSPQQPAPGLAQALSPPSIQKPPTLPSPFSAQEQRGV